MKRRVTDTVSLSQEFHQNSEPFLNEHPETVPPMVQQAKSYKDSQRVRLPETQAGSVGRFAAARRSVRGFADAPLPLAQLAGLLRSGYKVIGPDDLASGQRMLRRPVPSAGGLYPLELYVLVRNVEDLATGLYHYDSVADDLAAIAQSPWEQEAEKAFYSWRDIKAAPAIICVGAVFARTQTKYGPRGYRYVLLEAGHVVQNICLAASENNLATLCLGGYRDSVLNRLLGLDGNCEAVVYSVAAGENAAG